MSFIQQIRKALVASTLVLVLTIANAGSVLAQPLRFITTSSYLAQTDTSLGQKAKATAKKVEGKAQETLGNVTGDREAQIQGKVKQAEGEIRAQPSDLSGNKVDTNLESEIEGKTQQAESNIRRFQSREIKATNLKQAID